MKDCPKYIVIIIVGIYIIFSAIFVSPAAATNPKEKATVSKIIDGDSIEVSQGSKLSVIRLYGIDSPEWGQPYSKKAKFYLKKLILGRTVQLEVLYTDKFARSVALVYCQGNCVNQLLVEQGLAWVHIYYCHKKICDLWINLEKAAKAKKLGIWKDERPVPPWVWKRRKQK